MKTEGPLTLLAGRYVLEDETGRVSWGSVWRAADRVLDRKVTVKILAPQLAVDLALVRRFVAQARAAAGLSHPGIARVLDGGADGRLVFIVTELVGGESLRELLTREGPLDPARAAAIISAVTAPLAAAHRAGFVHADLDAEHVLVGMDGRLRIADLGLARAVRGDGADVDADVRAAAALLYECLTGRPPASERPIPPRAMRPGIPRTLDVAVMRALAGGFASTDEFAGAVRRAGTEIGAAAVRSGVGFGVASAAPPPPLDERSSFFRTWLLVPLLLLVAVGALVALGLAFGRLEIGGPLGIEPKPVETVRPPPMILPIQGVSAFDPFGDGVENDAGVASASDGDGATSWLSENYFDGRLNKPGVGLLFDLGTSRTVTGFRLTTPVPGFRFRVLVGEDPAALAGESGTDFTAAAEMRTSIEPRQGRYVLLWITSVVPVEGGANRAEVAEFKVLGEGG